MTNPDGNAGETSPSEPSAGTAEPSSSGYEAPPIEQSQDRPQAGETQPFYDVPPPGYDAGPAYPPVHYPPDYPPPPPPGPPAYGPPPQMDPLAPLDYPANGGLPPPVFGQSPSYPGAGYPPPGYPAAPGYQGYPYQPDPYDPYRQNRPPGTNGMAIASLACSVAGLICCLPAVVGLILGFMGMRETRRTGQEGFGLALAGTIIGGIITAGALVYILVLLVVAGTSV